MYVCMYVCMYIYIYNYIDLGTFETLGMGQWMVDRQKSKVTGSAERQESVMAIATMAEPIMSNPPPEGSAALSVSHMSVCLSTCEVW